MSDRIEVFKNDNGKYQWRIRASNRRVLATSDEYKDKANCKQIAVNFSKRHPEIKVAKDGSPLPKAF